MTQQPRASLCCYYIYCERPNYAAIYSQTANVLKQALGTAAFLFILAVLCAALVVGVGSLARGVPNSTAFQIFLGQISSTLKKMVLLALKQP